MNTKTPRFVDILLVEDSPTDVIITREAFEEFRVLNKLHVVEDGIQAMAYLRRQGEYAAATRPDLILLDLNLPRKHGREVLTEIKRDPALKSIPVVVLTTSQSERDVLEAYDQHANCYIVKPVGFENFLEALKTIRQFWFGVVTLPTEVEHESG